jgi:hypothetical protein
LRAALLLVAAVVLLAPAPATAQFQEPCELACIGVLGATGFIAATGTAVAVGRITGGMSTVNRGLLVWGTSFTAVVGGGMALSGNGNRQERAVYAAGVGTLAGALTGLALEVVRTDGDGPRVLAGALMGAAAGAFVGGVYGALSYDGDDDSGPVPLVTLTIPF